LYVNTVGVLVWQGIKQILEKCLQLPMIMSSQLLSKIASTGQARHRRSSGRDQGDCSRAMSRSKCKGLGLNIFLKSLRRTVDVSKTNAVGMTLTLLDSNGSTHRE
jgi:hypothetical protein